MELKDTVAGMLSKSYAARFRAEYWQLRIRKRSLDATLESWEQGTLPFEPSCPKSLLLEQRKCMESYLDLLERRAQLEDIIL